MWQCIWTTWRACENSDFYSQSLHSVSLGWSPRIYISNPFSDAAADACLGIDTLWEAIFLDACFSKCGPHTSSISISWELVRNIDSQTPPRLLLNPNPHVNMLPRCLMCTLKFKALLQRKGHIPFNKLGEGYICWAHEVGHGPCIWENSSLRSAHFVSLIFSGRLFFTHWFLPQLESSSSVLCRYHSVWAHSPPAWHFLPWH